MFLSDLIIYDIMIFENEIAWEGNVNNSTLLNFILFLKITIKSCRFIITLIVLVKSTFESSISRIYITSYPVVFLTCHRLETRRADIRGFPKQNKESNSCSRANDVARSMFRKQRGGGNERVWKTELRSPTRVFSNTKRLRVAILS